MKIYKNLLLMLLVMFCTFVVNGQKGRVVTGELTSTNMTLQKRCVKPPYGMVAWFPFDEKSGTEADNLITGGNAGLLVNGPSHSAGMVKNALAFNGKNFVEVANQTKLNIGTGNFSIDAWIKMPRNAGKGVRAIVDKRVYQKGFYRGYMLFIYNGRLALQMSDGKGTSRGFTNFIASGSTPYLATGRWQHVTVTVNRKSKKGITYFVNGVNVGNANPLGRRGSLSNNSSMRIGAETLNKRGSGFFIGGIDEVEIFKRVISPADVRRIYRAREAGKCKGSGNSSKCCPPTTNSSIDLSTGIKADLPGNPIYSAGATDKFWRVISTPNGQNTGEAYVPNLSVSPFNVYVKFPKTTYINSNQSDSGIYEYERCFCIDNPAKAKLDVLLRADNTANVFLNQYTNRILQISHIDSFKKKFGKARVTRGFVLGRNCLRVRIKNISGITGFDAKIKASGWGAKKPGCCVKTRRLFPKKRVDGFKEIRNRKQP